MGRNGAEMRGEFLSHCVMFIHPHGDGEFPCNEDEVEGQRVMPELYENMFILG